MRMRIRRETHMCNSGDVVSTVAVFTGHVKTLLRANESHGHI
jgi:hypothetical protein